MTEEEFSQKSSVTETNIKLSKMEKRKQLGEDDSNDEIKKFKKQKADEHKINKKQNLDDSKDGEKLDTETNPSEKPDWKKIKLERKEMKIKRKQKEAGEGNEIYELGMKAKKIWEEVRRDDCETGRKKQLCKELYNLIKGKAKLLINAHDTVRVIETLISVGGEEYWSYLFVELKDEMLNLCKNKYSRFFVLKLLRYGTRDQKDEIMKSMEGQIVSLMKHKVACDVVELAYNDYANAKQRSSMLQEFFGPRFRLFKEDVHTLAEVIEKHPESKERILKDINNVLQVILEKGVFTNILIHTLLKEYLYVCDENSKKAIIDSIKEKLLPIIHTRDGARIAMICLWHGSAKDRKSIIKSFKGNFLKVATEDHAYMVLLAAFDCIDDTVLVKKIILSELIKDIDRLAGSDSGRKVIKYLVAPRLKTFFHPKVIEILEEGDSNPHTKKDRSTKFLELQTGENSITEPVLKLILKNIKVWVRDSKWTLFIGTALKNLEGELITQIFEAIVEICSEPFIPGGETHFLESSCMCQMITYLIRTDEDRYKNKIPLFSSHLITIQESEMRGWILANRGCFILINLYETEIPEIVEHVNTVCSPIKKKLETFSYRGAEILLNKIK